MNRTTKVLTAICILLVSLLPTISEMSIPTANADDPGPYAMIFPSNGTVLTQILIEVRNLTNGVEYALYLFWDNVRQIQALPNHSEWIYDPMLPPVQVWYGYYVINITAPTHIHFPTWEIIQ